MIERAGMGNPTSDAVVTEVVFMLIDVVDRYTRDGNEDFGLLDAVGGLDFLSHILILL